ncbi:type II toxin-antitoxin system prevent-host-death family antitoxin [Haematomicrobium sanguinis]|uniref:type II toxin-antitoxin system prevent-host-death family antitoxin n=1 Tax=Haematomicrobium sanguinis TaxID=479106 RepID=UPI00047AD28A|nr:type II toxin-antitoxin system prevent-host-death family antitoxin [Haematomicrobium sanguinis]
MAHTTTNLTVGQLKDSLSNAINSASYGQERVGITKHGKLTAALISVEDLELLEALEDASDLHAYQTAKAEDDGTRVSLEELQAETRNS